MQTKRSQSTITPEKPLEILSEGDSWFVQYQKTDRDLLQLVSYTGKNYIPASH